MQVDAVQLDAVANATLPRLSPAPSSENPEFAAALAKAGTADERSTTVGAQRTPLTAAEAGSALRSAWERHFGAAPSKETVAVLTAQWAHETGNGQSMFNYNFGGIKGVGPGGLTVHQRTREGYGANERTIFDNFRAYQNADEGATDYLSLLVRKYPGAIEAADLGDAEGFVRGLKRGGYFTGSESAYISAVERHSRHFLRNSPTSTLAPTESAATSEIPTSLTFESLALAERQGEASPLGSSMPLRANVESHGPEPHHRDAPIAGLGLQMFDDALSRAALRIALNPHPSERTQS